MGSSIFTSSFKANSSSGDKIGEEGAEVSGDCSSYVVGVLFHEKKLHLLIKFVFVCCFSFIE